MKIDLGHNGIVQSSIVEEDGALHFVDSMDAQPIIDANARLRTEGYNRRAHMRPVASIPITEYYNWHQEWKRGYADKWTWPTFLMAKIRDRDYSKFRTSDLKV